MPAKSPLIFVLSLAIILGSLGPGCSTTVKTTRIEKTDHAAVAAGQDQPLAPEASGTKTVETETVTKTETKSSAGVVGSTINLFGDILAFPFQMIANVFRFIF